MNLASSHLNLHPEFREEEIALILGGNYLRVLKHPA
jgi:hypothetical protein